MNVSLNNYHRFARVLGSVLSLYGGGLLTAGAILTLTGTNPLAPDFDPLTVMLAAVMGAFVLPLGASLFLGDEHTTARVRVAAYALALNALVRLAPLAIPEVLATFGPNVPYAESVVFGTMALLAFVIRPPGGTAHGI